MPDKPKPPLAQRLRDALAVFRQIPGTLELLWKADARGAIVMLGLTVVLASMPVAIAWVGKLIIDAVVTASRTGLDADRAHVGTFVALELGLVAAQTALTRVAWLQRELTGAKLGFDINVKILEKAL